MARKPQEILEDVLATFAVLLEEEYHVDPYEIDWKQNTREFTKDGDIERFGTVMIELHLLCQVEIDYEPYTEFDNFSTLEDACGNVMDKVLTKEGYSPKTLKPVR